MENQAKIEKFKKKIAELADEAQKEGVKLDLYSAITLKGTISTFISSRSDLMEMGGQVSYFQHIVNTEIHKGMTLTDHTVERFKTPKNVN